MDPIGIVVSPLIKAVIEKFLLPEITKLASQEGLDTTIQKLKETLEDINLVLADAEDKQISNRAVKKWLEDLHHWAYDADDVLDEFATEALRRKLMMAEGLDDQSSSTSKVRRFFTPTCYTGLTPSTIAFNSTIRSKIKEINSQLQDFATKITKLGLVEKVVGKMSSNVWQRPPTTCLMKEPCVYGRDEDIKQIIELLLRDAPNENKVDVIPIVGMGGIGKTTLAQVVYNDGIIKNHFNLKAWVCVSDEFDVMRITKAILESFTLQPCNLGELNEVQVKLNEMLAGKKFLLVLDDVWNHMHDEWNLLRSPFGVGAHGSKIIVTTRNTHVALQMETAKHHYLHNLSNDDCWLIFAQYAFENRNISEHQELELIGKTIVAKCGGLPLAARALGCLLHYKPEYEWEEVLNSNTWNSPYVETGILPALKLSYHHLPSHLKRCFSYCAIIPKDYKFEEEELVLLWMAEGLINVLEGRKQMEVLGSEYFHELVSRSFFQSSSGNKSQFIMHDLVNDLAQVVAGDMCFRFENHLEGCKHNKISKKTRHSSYVASQYDGIKKFSAFDDARSLRTFVQFCPPRTEIRFITGYLFHDLLPNLKCLRELRLCGYRIYELPDSIGDLKHLRYLNVSKTHIRRLPDSVMTLYNLQILLLKFCNELEKLPPSMGSLENLRHLDMTGAKFPSLGEMPLQIGRLTNLQTLSNFMVGEDNGRRIGELGKLSDIRGVITISRLEKINDARDAREANLNSKQGLEQLSLEWEVSHHVWNVEVDRDVLEMLRPCKLLKQLTIKGYGSTTFPIWVGDDSFSRMVSMRLEHCKLCTSLPPLGQLPLLKDLYIEGMSAIKHVGCEFFGQGCTKPFPLLERLQFVNMPQWDDWSNSGVHTEVQLYTCLSVLSIQNCPKLVGRLPNELPCLEILKIKNCPQLQVDFSSLVLTSLTSLHMADVPLPDLPTLLQMRKTVEFGRKTVEFGSLSLVTSCVSSISVNAMSWHLTSVSSLCVKNFGNLTFIPKWYTRGSMGLEKLEIKEGQKLVTLWQNEMELQDCHPSLRHLEISQCPQLVSVFEEEEEEEAEEGKQQQQHEVLPCILRLECLRIEDCQMLEKLPRRLHTLTSLGVIDLSYCPSLVSLPKRGFPFMLRKLWISNCNALQSLGGLMTLNNLEWLSVSQCASLTYLSSSGGLPFALKHMEIYECKKLVSLLAEEEGMKINCPSLETIHIQKCRNLKCLPDALHSSSNNNLRNLSRLKIERCNNLESLPEGWFHPTISLRHLTINRCEKLEVQPLRAHDESSCSSNRLTSFQSLYLRDCPEGIISYFLKGVSFLTNLSSLTIGIKQVVSQKLPSPSAWGLHRLSSLRTLQLEGPSPPMEVIVSFTEDGMLLPTSLICLGIYNFPNLERLSSSSKEFQNLSSLESLRIFDCPRFTSFPKEGLPSSLLHLQVRNCPELASFPKQGLPPSLLHLKINGCPKLKTQCEKGKGQYWRNIAYLPHIQIDND